MVAIQLIGVAASNQAETSALISLNNGKYDQRVSRMTTRHFHSRLISLLVAWIATFLFVECATAQPVSGKIPIVESETDQRVFDVRCKLSVTGKTFVTATGNTSKDLDLKVDATFRFRERRLSGAGRDYLAFRSLRYYDDALASINVDGHKTVTQISEPSRFLVAQLLREGVDLYSPNTHISQSELDLLKMPGDPLAVLPMLPKMDVALNDEWRCDSWTVQSLLRTEAVIKENLTCKLIRLTESQATVSFSGFTEGATRGAKTRVGVKGQFVFDRLSKHVMRIELTQTEKSSISAVAPGSEVTASMTVDRVVAPTIGVLTDQAAGQIPLNPKPAQLLLSYRTPWNSSFLHGRNWHVFHQTNRVAVLRLVDGGNMIAQCNISPVEKVAPGKHTLPAQFQADIRSSLGDRFKQFGKAEELTTEDGRYVLRVETEGISSIDEKSPMTWLYYLCAAPDGRQISFVFSVRTTLARDLADRDKAIVHSFQFSRPQAARKPEN